MESELLVKFCRNKPIIFEEIKTEIDRQRRNEALDEIKILYETEIGKKVTKGVLLGQINQLKAKLMMKMEKKGKKPILENWEKELLDLIEGKAQKETVIKISIEKTPDVKSRKSLKSIKRKRSPSPEESSPSPPPCPTKVFVHENKYAEYNLKYAEYNHISNEDLQRMVLIEQLEVFKLKKEKLLDEKMRFGW